MTSRRRVFIEKVQGRHGHSMDLRQKLHNKRDGPVGRTMKRVIDLPGPGLDCQLGKRSRFNEEENTTQAVRRGGVRPEDTLTERDHHRTSPQRGHKTVTVTGPQLSPWLDMIVMDLHPHTIVEEQGFLHLMTSLGHSGESIPSAADVYSELVQTYDQMKENVRRALEVTESVTLACDFWKSKAEQFQMTVTSHSINESWKQVSFVLETTLIPRKSSGEDIVKQLVRIARMWDVEKKVQVVVTNANALEKAIQKVGWEHSTCFAKTLDKVWRQITKHADVQKVLKWCCKVAEFFCYNAEARRNLREAQIEKHLPQHNLISAEDDKWMTTLHMLERLSKQKDALSKVLLDMNQLDLLQSEDDWNVMWRVMEALRPFKEVTEEITKDPHCSAANIIPCMQELKRNLEEQTKNRVAQSLAEHLGSDQFRPTHCLTMSTILDPRYKQIVFSDPLLDPSRLIDEIHLEIKTKNPPITPFSRFSEKLENYRKMDPRPKEGNPLSFWRFNYKKLSSVARKYLNVVITAVPLDRAFDMQKSQLLSSRRSLLPQELLNMMLFLNGNCSTEVGEAQSD